MSKTKTIDEEFAAETLAALDNVVTEFKPVKKDSMLMALGGWDKMAASQRAEFMCFESKNADNYRFDEQRNCFWVYQDNFWKEVDDSRVSRDVGEVFDSAFVAYKPIDIKNVLGCMQNKAELIEEQKPNLLAFKNGVYNIETGALSMHQRDNFIRSYLNVDFREVNPAASYEDLIPNFFKWLAHSCGGNANKMRMITAALYMVITKRYDWQVFLEVVGKGGTGKSIFVHICRQLVGKDFHCTADAETFESARERDALVGKSLITLSEQKSFVGKPSGLIAITGNDAVSIDPKHKKPYSAHINAVVIFTNNEPMIFTERNGGIGRRRVIVTFDNVVAEEDKDLRLNDKLDREMGNIVQFVLNEFENPIEARKLLLEQRDGKESLMVKIQSDPLLEWCSTLCACHIDDGMLAGTNPKAGVKSLPEDLLYHNYLEFMHDIHNGKGILNVKRWGTSLSNMFSQLGYELDGKKTNKGKRYNLAIKTPANKHNAICNLEDI